MFSSGVFVCLFVLFVCLLLLLFFGVHSCFCLAGYVEKLTAAVVCLHTVSDDAIVVYDLVALLSPQCFLIFFYITAIDLAVGQNGMLTVTQENTTMLS